MTEQTKQQDQEQTSKNEPKPMTKAEAAKLVKRNVPKLDDKGKIEHDKDGNPKTREQAIKEDEVMSFADYGDHVVVVTTSGEKLRGEKK